MAFTIDPTLPPDSGESATLGALRIRNVATWLLQMFGLPAVSTPITIPPMTVTPSTGAVVFPSTVTLAADPASALQAATKQYVDVTAGQQYVATSTSNVDGTYTATLAPVPASYAVILNRVIIVRFSATTSLSATLNLNGLGAKPVKTNGAVISAGNPLIAATSIVVYDGTSFNVIV